MPIWTRRSTVILALLAMMAVGRHTATAQPTPTYDLLLAGGHVIDPANDLDGPMDVAIDDGRIARVASSIPASQAEMVMDVSGLYVTPGLIDLHTHVYYSTNVEYGWGGGQASIRPDDFSFRAGVTTIVDAGSSGWRTFPAFKRQIIDHARTRVLAFLNIVGDGMRAIVEQNVADMDPDLTAMRIRSQRDVLVGVKSAHFEGPGWDSVDRALEAGRLAETPIMVDFGTFRAERPYQELVTSRLRPGDISTHMYLARVPMLDDQGSVRPYLFEAQQRGVIFDVGHGAGSFVFHQAVPATQQGFWPNTISTDLHSRNINGGAKDLLSVMSKFLNLGMTLPQAIARATTEPARVIGRADLGTLSEGSEADVAVLRLHDGSFGFVDVSGGRLDGAHKLEGELTIRAGEVVWDLNGLAARRWDAVR